MRQNKKTLLIIQAGLIGILLLGLYKTTGINAIALIHLAIFLIMRFIYTYGMTVLISVAVFNYMINKTNTNQHTFPQWQKALWGIFILITVLSWIGDISQDISIFINRTTSITSEFRQSIKSIAQDAEECD